MKRRLPTIIFSLLVILLVLSSCTAPEMIAFLPKLEGYWRYESMPFMFGAGFTQIIQNNDQITMRSITESSDVMEALYKLEDPGLVRTRENNFTNGVQLLSGETLPTGIYTIITKYVADISNNEIKLFQEFEYILHEGVEKLYKQDDMLASYVRALPPENIAEWVKDFSPRLEVQTSYKDFVAGEVYTITFNLISDEDLPNMATEGSITLTCNQKTFTLMVDRIHWFNVYSLTNYDVMKFVLIRATHPDFSLISGCANMDVIHVIEGSAYIDETNVGTIIF